VRLIVFYPQVIDPNKIVSLSILETAKQLASLHEVLLISAYDEKIQMDLPANSKIEWIRPFQKFSMWNFTRLLPKLQMFRPQVVHAFEFFSVSPFHGLNFWANLPFLHLSIVASYIHAPPRASAKSWMLDSQHLVLTSEIPRAEMEWIHWSYPLPHFPKLTEKLNQAFLFSHGTTDLDAIEIPADQNILFYIPRFEKSWDRQNWIKKIQEKKWESRVQIMMDLSATEIAAHIQASSHVYFLDKEFFPETHMWIRYALKEKSHTFYTHAYSQPFLKTQEEDSPFNQVARIYAKVVANSVI
jgi:hypothetical protein